jgi:Beta xylosidase C-terminal Concanavalin A-like domain
VRLRALAGDITSGRWPDSPICRYALPQGCLQRPFYIGTAINRAIATGTGGFRRSPEQVAKDIAEVKEPQTDAFTPLIAIPAGKAVHLRVEVDYERLHFGYRVANVDHEWRWLPQQFDASILSDEATAPGLPNFTGAFVGMACQDLVGTLIPADFDFFEYRERGYLENPFLA